MERKQRDAKLQKQRDALGESAAGELHKLQALKSSQQELPSVYAKAAIKAQNGGEQVSPPASLFALEHESRHVKPVIVQVQL